MLIQNKTMTCMILEPKHGDFMSQLQSQRACLNFNNPDHGYPSQAILILCPYPFNTDILAWKVDKMNKNLSDGG